MTQLHNINLTLYNMTQLHNINLTLKNITQLQDINLTLLKHDTTTQYKHDTPKI